MAREVLNRVGLGVEVRVRVEVRVGVGVRVEVRVRVGVRVGLGLGLRVRDSQSMYDSMVTKPEGMRSLSTALKFRIDLIICPKTEKPIPRWSMTA